jgi:hypothetical protein
VFGESSIWALPTSPDRHGLSTKNSRRHYAVDQVETTYLTQRVTVQGG